MNRSKTIFIGCAVASAAFFVSHIQAQERGGGNMMMRMMMAGRGQLYSELLVMEKVQTELEMTDEQIEEMGESAAEINDAWRTERREIIMDGGDDAEVNELLKELRAEEKELVSKLNDKQLNRLNQLRHQRMGTAMYRDESVAESLGITPDQKKDIDAAFEVTMVAIQKAAEEARESGNFRAIMTASRELDAKLAETITGFLNDEQQELVKEMTGEPFEFPQRRRGRAPRDF